MDMKKKLLFVFNPCSGKAQIKNQLLDIVDTMVKADYEVTIYPTQCAGDAKEKVEAYAGNYDLVVCSGGDGTLDGIILSMSQHLDFLQKCLIRRARNGKMYSDMPLIF